MSSPKISVPKERQSLSRKTAAQHVRDLISRGEVDLVRQKLSEYVELWPEDPGFRQLAIALAPPVARAASLEEVPRRIQEGEWLRLHGREYPGEWLAVQGDQLLDHDTDVRALRERLRNIPGGATALVHCEPGKEWC